MSSGIKTTAEAVALYNTMVEKHLHKFLLLKFSDDLTKVEVANIGEKDATFDDMLKVLPKDRTRYIFYDCKYTTTSGQPREKVLFVNWSSDDGPSTKDKVLLTTTEKEVMAKCKKFAKHTTINSWDELTEDNFINLVSNNRSN